MARRLWLVAGCGSATSCGGRGRTRRLSTAGQLNTLGLVVGSDEVFVRHQVKIAWPDSDNVAWSTEVYTLDLVEPGDGDEVLAPRAEGAADV